MKIAVLKGGFSPERDVSLVSGSEIGKELQHRGYEVVEFDPGAFPDSGAFFSALKAAAPDVVFNGLHGGSGEDGQLQAALSLQGFRSTGSGFKACVLAMDKYVSKMIAAAEGIPVPKYILMRENLIEDYNDPEDYASFAATLGLPIVVKPNDSGSSVGISVVDSLEELKPAVHKALEVSPTIILEEYIPGRELTVTILDGKALPVVEIKPVNGWYDYTNKYNKGKTNYEAPAQLDESTTQLVQLYALRIWRAMGLSGYARIDFRYDGQKPFFLEVNTLPGMTPLSLTPMAAKAADIPFGELLQKIIEISLHNAGRYQ